MRAKMSCMTFLQKGGWRIVRHRYNCRNCQGGYCLATSLREASRDGLRVTMRCRRPSLGKEGTRSATHASRQRVHSRRDREQLAGVSRHPSNESTCIPMDRDGQVARAACWWSLVRQASRSRASLATLGARRCRRVTTRRLSGSERGTLVPVCMGAHTAKSATLACK